jgi:predicted branched-subunit amino acid permease
MNTYCLKIALKTTIPVFLGYISCGIAFGLVTVNAGYPWWLAPAMGVLIFAGAGQFLAIPLFKTIHCVDRYGRCGGKRRQTHSCNKFSSIHNIEF